MIDRFPHNPSIIDWLLVFLGNPGRKYDNTRHNAGFLVGDEIARREKVKVARLRFQALWSPCGVGGKRTFLLKPQTFMNSSGDAVREAVAYYKTPPERILVVSDDVALPLGKLRIRKDGSAGGHNGLKSVIAALGTEEFPRLRVGVGAPEQSEREMIDWVLGKFQGEEAEIMAETVKRAADAVECIMREGIDMAMGKYN